MRYIITYEIYSTNNERIGVKQTWIITDNRNKAVEQFRRDYPDEKHYRIVNISVKKN